MIYFEPQTGIVKRVPIRSNFYVFRVEDSCLAKIELAVSKAGLDGSGLKYDDEFMEWLVAHDTKWDQRKGLPVPFEFGGIGEKPLADWSRCKLQQYLEGRVFAVYDSEGEDVLREAVMLDMDGEANG